MVLLMERLGKVRGNGCDLWGYESKAGGLKVEIHGEILLSILKIFT